MRTNYIFVTGGVISGLGKGVTTASIGKLLQYQGYSVTAIKIDPYLNIDAGTMRPTVHGEVWVTDDGGEIDQDLGNYERFLGISLGKEHNITTGKIYSEVIRKERAGEYLGKDVQPIPDLTDEIQRRIEKIAKQSLADFVLIEIGGTVGDYENIMFLEAAREMHQKGKNVIFVHVAYLPVPNHLGEMKTKPLQHSVKNLQSLGIFPDFIIGRSSKKIDDVRKSKITANCNIAKDAMISLVDVGNIYEVPLVLEGQHLTEKILNLFNMKYRPSNKGYINWYKFISAISRFEKEVTIGIIGKYFSTGEFTLSDSYISVIEAVKHACWANKAKPKILWLDSREFEKDPKALHSLKALDAVIVPGGFGTSGVEGKISAIKYCRERNLPYLGLCLGMQLAVVEFSRNVCNLKKAHSVEMDPDTEHPVVDILPEQVSVLYKKDYGASMRLGAWEAMLKPHTLVWNLYNKADKISERHRHRYEVSPDYVKLLETQGITFSGYSEDKNLMEFLELKNHPYFVATQSHPEFKSRPLRPAPLFDGLVKAALKQRKTALQKKFK